MPDHEETQDEAQHGGRRSGAGRPRGSVNRRTSALRDAISAEGVDPAVALVRIGKAAEAREDFGLAVEAYGKVLPFLHAKPRTAADAHPEEALEFAKAMLAAKVDAAADAIANNRGLNGLAERLDRAKARVEIHVNTGIDRAPDDVSVTLSAPAPDLGQVIDAKPVQPAPVAPAGPSPASATEPPPAAYKPILPRSDVPPAAADWAAPAPAWPQRQAFAELPPENPFDAAPFTGGLLGSRNS